MTIRTILEKLLDRQALTEPELRHCFQLLARGQLSDAQLAAFLMLMRAKGESISELSTCATIMLESATPLNLPAHCLDIVGTGGDGANLFNVSTISAFVAAAAGACVAKHGNRAASSRSGALDLLTEAGMPANVSPQTMEKNVTQLGIGFLIAPQLHPLLKSAATVRQQLGVRTLFNLTGVLTNPARPKHQLVGLYDKALLAPMAKAFARLGSQHALLVHSEEGLDEISLAHPTHVVELKDGQLQSFLLTPEDCGLKRQSMQTLTVQSPAESLQLAMSVFHHEEGPARDMICLNAGAALYAADIAQNITAGVQLAQITLKQGKALERFQQFIKQTQ